MMTIEPLARSAVRQADAVIPIARRAAAGPPAPAPPPAAAEPERGDAAPGGADADVAGLFSQAINAGIHDGAPLPVDLRGRFERSLGADLGRVRIHTGEQAARAAGAFGAEAFAHGRDVYFAAGAYRPGTPEGDHLIAHEVAHTVQQAGGAAGPQLRAVVSEPGDTAEHDADRAADAMVIGSPVAPGTLVASGPAIHRQARGRFRGRASTRDRLDRLLAPDSPLWAQLNPDASAAVNCPATAATLDQYLSSGRAAPAAGGSDLARYRFTSNPAWSQPAGTIQQATSRLGDEHFVVVEGRRPPEFAARNNVTETHYFVVARHRGRTYVIDLQGRSASTDVAGYVNQQGFATYRHAQQRVQVALDEVDLESSSPP